MSGEVRLTPGPWLNWETFEWLHEPHKLLTNTGDALLMGAAPDMLEALQAISAVDEFGLLRLSGQKIREIAHSAIDKAEGRS